MSFLELNKLIKYSEYHIVMFIVIINTNILYTEKSGV